MRKIESLYIHFPFCRHLCNYCDFYKKIPVRGNEDQKDFHEYLEKSFVRHESLMKQFGYSWSPLKTLYVGGGTPSLWGKEGSAFLQKFLNERQITLAADCEFTLEVNPGSWTAESLESWEDIGVNRYSLGIQALNSDLIKFLDRVHGLEDVYETLDYFGANGKNFSVDFMLGLPHSKKHERDIEKELGSVLKYRPQHFSVYILTVKENYKHFGDIPDEDWIEAEYLAVADFLKKNHFTHYEVSNFALPGKESKHNLNYWKTSTVAALGPSATGYLSADSFRYKWKTINPEFESESLSAEETLLERVYMNLRSAEGLSSAHFPNAEPESIDLFRKWTKRGIASFTSNDRIVLNSKGYLILDSLMDEIFMSKLIK